METLNAGDVPLGKLIDGLFSERGLERLVGQRGTACFVLARSALMPDFYRQLIQNVDTIDATTREYIAFIVFYGNHSSFSERPTTRPLLYKYSIQGLSSTADNEICLAEPNDPESVMGSKLAFDTEQTNRLRLKPRSKIANDTARVTELASSILMERFGIFESMLPCLLFVSRERLHRPELVRLDPKEPMRSLYSDALAPLSDEFRRLQPYWELWRGLEWEKRDRKEALETIEKSKEAEAILRESLEKAAQKLSERPASLTELEELKSKQAELRQLCHKYETADSLRERVMLFQQLYPADDEVQRLVLRLAGLEEEKRSLESRFPTEDARQRVAKLLSSINRTRNKLGNAAAQPYIRNRSSQEHIESRIYQLSIPEQEHEQAQYRLRALQDSVEAARRTLTRLSEAAMARREQQVKELYSDLRSRNFDDKILNSYHPSAIDVVETLIRCRRIGALHVSEARDAAFRILFLAANPLNTTALDLEDELRAVERELRGTRYREKILLSARHAVRPDDLVRYVRDERPDAVHFSGHGTSEGIVLRDDAGGHHIVKAQPLARFFSGRGVRLVVLNCCYSEEQAKAIATAVDTVVGTKSALEDEAARRFSVAFYRTLADGHPIAEAFRDGGDSLPLHNLSDVYHLQGRSDWQLKFQGALPI